MFEEHKLIHRYYWPLDRMAHRETKIYSEQYTDIPIEEFVHPEFWFAACTRRSPIKARSDAVRPTWWN